MILGLDISTTATGWAIFSKDGVLKKSGVIKPKSTEKDFLKRSMFIARQLKKIMLEYKISKACVEDLKVLRNQKTLVRLAICVGVITSSLMNENVEILFVSPTVWRKQYEIKGKRNELKNKAIQHVLDNFGKLVTDDEAEAILIANYMFILSKKQDNIFLFT